MVGGARASHHGAADDGGDVGANVLGHGDDVLLVGDGVVGPGEDALGDGGGAILKLEGDGVGAAAEVGAAGHPGDHDAVAFLDVRDLAAGGDHGASRLVPEELGRGAGTVHLVKLRVADAAGELLDDDLVGPGVGEGDLVDAEGAGLGGADNNAGVGRHGKAPFSGSGGESYRSVRIKSPPELREGEGERGELFPYHRRPTTSKG